MPSTHQCSAPNVLTSEAVSPPVTYIMKGPSHSSVSMSSTMLNDSHNWAPEGPFLLLFIYFLLRVLGLQCRHNKRRTGCQSKVPSHQLSVGADCTPPASTSSSSLLSPEVAMMTLQDHPELRALLSLLPSKQDMCTLASDFKSAWCQDLQTDVGELQQKVQRLEDSQASMQQLISSVQTSSSARDSLHHTLVAHMNVLENRNRRNNVRLRGVPQSIRTPDLIPTLTKFFNSILGRDPDTRIEFARAHRALRPQIPDPTHPQDIVCRIHLYVLKRGNYA